jgi:hypothetical protein
LHPGPEGIARRHADHVNARVAGREEFLIHCRGADERTRERLGTSDIGIALPQDVAGGTGQGRARRGSARRHPRPGQNQIIELKHEKEKGQFADVDTALDLIQLKRSREQFNPRIAEILEFYERGAN